MKQIFPRCCSRFIAVITILITSQVVWAQAGTIVSRTPGTAHTSAALDIVADGTPTWKGLLIPRMTSSDITSIASPATGLLVYQTDGITGFYLYNGSGWNRMSTGALSGAGTANNAAKWTSGSALGNSIIIDDGANVGIGAAANASARLDVNSNNKGILFPQVSLTSVNDVSTVSSPATSLIVYNTNASITGGSGIGFYTFNGTKWQKWVSSKTTFTHWGINTCPASSSLVYAGYAAGAHYTHGGSGFNSVCLTNAPNNTGATVNDGNHNGALFYGMEYESGAYGVATLQAYQNYDAVCAVCLVDNASMTLMVPGSNSCPSTWSLQYWGYLMSTHYTHVKSEFVCVANGPMFTGSTADHNGNLWYPVEIELGSLAASSGYVQNREMTCAVCTK